MDLFQKFNAERCTLCGECFHKCPVMHLPLELAKDEIKRLIEGRETKRVLQKCTSCFACNFICPEGCNPTQKILDVWNEKSVRQGLPIRALYFTPDSPLNFRTYVLDRLPRDERELVRSWEDTSPCEEVFYPGAIGLPCPI